MVNSDQDQKKAVSAQKPSLLGALALDLIIVLLIVGTFYVRVTYPLEVSSLLIAEFIFLGLSLLVTLFIVVGVESFQSVWNSLTTGSRGGLGAITFNAVILNLILLGLIVAFWFFRSPLIQEDQ